MPNRWESSTRPLSVKTVYVNGSRHAILSPEDPLLHSGIFSFKRQSRPNSSMSISSIFSISSSESQDSISAARGRSLKSGKVRRRHRKNTPAMLQDCFVQLRLTNNHRVNVREAKNDKNSGDSLEKTEVNSVEANLKEDQKKLNHFKGNHKCCRHCYEVFSKENKLAETKKESNNCCYVYDFESNKGRKNYSFVKIASGKPSHCILDCNCEKNFCGSKDCPPSDKNNYVISATVHNLIMEADKNENQLHNLIPIGESNFYELPRNNDKTTHYNPLPERVLQWLDLASKKKRRSVAKTSSEDVALLGNVERISAGRTFIDENNKSRYSEKPNCKPEDKTVVKKEKVMERETSDEDVETEVKGEGNIETVLSMQKLENVECLKGRHSPVRHPKSKELVEEISQSNQALNHTQADEDPKVTSIPTKIDSNSLMTALLKNSIADRLNFTMSAINFKDLIQKIDLMGGQIEFSCQNKNIGLKEKQNCIVTGSKSADVGSEHGDADKKLKISAIKFWERNEHKKNSISLENVDKATSCDCMINKKECEKGIKNLNEEFEKYQKSINNSNITRRRCASQNLYPQQHNKASGLRDRRTVWIAEKNTIRPQLHIFIPSLPSKDPCDEAASECESFSNEVS